SPGCRDAPHGGWTAASPQRDAAVAPAGRLHSIGEARLPLRGRPYSCGDRTARHGYAVFLRLPALRSTRVEHSAHGADLHRPLGGRRASVGVHGRRGMKQGPVTIGHATGSGIVIDVGCATFQKTANTYEDSVLTLIQRFKPAVLFGFDLLPWVQESVGHMNG